MSVQVLCDKDQAQQAYSKIWELINSGIDVHFEKTKGYAHNKVIIVDKAVLVTGSYNFTHSAENRNSENMLIIRQQELVQSYLEDWKRAVNASL